jgi:hypothetical protein
MEWWSDGVMKELIQSGVRALAFSKNPKLQYSNTPVLQYSKRTL